MMDSPLISVIIPVYNDQKRLESCLMALKEQRVTHPFEILVVDNGSDENIDNLINKFEGVEYYKEKTVGSYAARNCGIKHSNGEVLAFTDADCIPGENWLQEGINFLNINTTCDACGGQIQLFTRFDTPNAFELYDIKFGFRQEKSISEHGYSVTANLFVRKKSMQRVGFFDENLKSGGDVEWCQRLTLEGGKLCFVEDAVVSHPALHSFKDFTTKHKRVAGGRFQREEFDFYQVCRASYHHLLSLRNVVDNMAENQLSAKINDKIKLWGVHLVRVGIYILTYIMIYVRVIKPERE